MADHTVDVVANVLQRRRAGRVLGLRGVLDGHRILVRSNDDPPKVLQRRHGGRVLDLLGSLEGQRIFVSGADDRPIRFAERPAPLRRAARLRARELLYSLLDQRQRAEAESSFGLFWEHTDIGWFRLGRYYDIRYRPAAAPEVEQSICVVTDHLGLVPADDLWVNLLVMLRADPAGFVATAFTQAVDTTFPEWRTTPARPYWYDDSQRFVRLLEYRAQHWAEGRHLDAAFTDFTMGHLLHEIGDHVAALWRATGAAAVVHAQATVFTDDHERTRWHAAHHAIYGLLAQLVAADTLPGRPAGFTHEAFERVRQDLLRGPAIDRAEQDLIAWTRSIGMLERTFTGVFR